MRLVPFVGLVLPPICIPPLLHSVPQQQRLRTPNTPMDPPRAASLPRGNHRGRVCRASPPRHLHKQLQGYAIKLGSDCPFFIGNSTALVTGVGDNLTEIDLDLTKYEIKIYDLGIHVSTKEAYSKITPKNYTDLESIVSDPIESWKDKLKNDFEEPLFLEHPKIRLMKEKLYKEGAIYVSMTGTGSALFSINMLN